MAAVELDPAPGRDPGALIKEAPRRQRRRYLAAGPAGPAGRYFVYVGDGTAVIRGDLRGRPRVLAKT